MAAKPPVVALRNIDLQVEKGEIFGLIGRNGAGKTTLSKIIATLVQPTKGTVLVKGFDTVKEDVRVRSLVGLAAAEERSFYWRLTAEQNMLFFARLYGLREKDARHRIAELFEQLDLVDLAKRRFSELSTGNKQRLAVARALVSRPEILLLDEPTRSLDPLAAASMRKMISSLENMTILLTSHNLTEIEELCGRIAVIANGAIRAVDAPENLRMSHKQTQNVKISLKAGTAESFQTLNSLKDFEIEENGGLIEVKFTRETDDDLLGNTIAELRNRDLKVMDVETEKATLLDVLESYE